LCSYGWLDRADREQQFNQDVKANVSFGLSFPLPKAPLPHLHSNFIGNRASNQSAVFTFRLPLVFTGKNIFRGNKGGAVYLLQTSLDAVGTLLFEDNSAIQGGAVTFEDFSVVFYLSSSFFFVQLSSC